MLMKWFFGLPTHLRIAVMVAPVLVIGGYGLADLWVTKDQPEQKEPIAMQPLQLQGDCLLSTNQCVLQHERMKVSLIRQDSGKPGIVRMEIKPDTNIRGVQLSLVQAGEEHRIVVDSSKDGNQWAAEFPEKLLTPSPSLLRIALAKFGSVSFAEIQPQF